MKMRFVLLSAFCLSAVILGPASLWGQGKTLRVCADPDYLPYSNRAGQGFENQIAAAVAKILGENLEYTWASYRGAGGFPEFLSRNLEANKCDVIMDIPYGSKEALSTQPYYISSYVFVFKKAKNYNIQSLDSAALKQVKIGFESDTPIEDGLKIRGLVPGHTTAFDVADNHSDESPSVMVDAVEKGDIDVLITWEPAIGAFLDKHADLDVVPVPNERALGPPERYSFPMSMGVREGNEALEKQLDDVIAKHQNELTAILTQHGVKLYSPEAPY